MLVAGEIDASAYANQAGEPAASLELTAREVKFLGGKPQEDETAQAPAQTPAAADMPF